MTGLDVEKILTGTPEKAFLAARKKLAEDYNSTTADDFFYSYCEQSLSFILNHSREIFSETYCGYNFYLDIIDHHTYDPRTYSSEAEKVRQYVDSARENKLPQSQIDMYDKLLERLISYASAFTNLSKCFEIAASSENGEEFIKLASDYLYDIDQKKKDGDSDDILLLMDNAAEVIFGVKNVYCKILMGFEFCYRNPKYIPYLIEATRSIMSDVGMNDDIGNVQRLSDCVSTILKDDVVITMLSRMGGTGPGTIMDYWMNIANNKEIATAHAAKLSENEVSEILNDAESENPISDDIDAVFQISESCESTDKERILCAKYDNFTRLREIYEAKAELASVYGGIILENAEDILCSIEAELAYMEWEDDGSPNAVIRQHIMTTKEREELAALNEKNKNTLHNSITTSNIEKENDIQNESELCDKIKAQISKIGNIDDMTTGGENDENIQKLIKSARSELDMFRKEATTKNYKRALDLCKDLEDEIKVSDPMYESVDSALDKNLLMFLEDDDDEKEPSEKPTKPKTDLATKIQNKALDHAAKDEERLAKSKEKTQKLKNAANAVSSTPKRVSDDLKKFVQDFDKWDDNRRKEFLLKPGYRHKIVKHLKKAITLGSVASVNLALVPFLAMINHCSKLKDKRIRNELAKELENEIHICEEKINDANSAGDNKSKYELMRIKDKLEAEKVRVRINSNYM